MRSRFAILLAVAVVCVTTVWAGWSPEGQITSNRLSNYLHVNNGRKIAVASNGVRHLVWSANTVHYKRYYPGSGWAPDYPLTTIKNSWYPSIALDPNGTDIHVVWEGDGGPKNSPGKHIYYQKCVPGSSGNAGWVGTPRDLTPNAGSSVHRAPAVASFRDGNNVDHIVVTWFVHNKDTVGFCESVAGNWGAPQYFHVPSGWSAWQASVAVDPQARYGDVFISCVMLVNYSPCPVFVRRRIDGVWQQWEDATANGNPDCFRSFMDVDPSTGCPHIVCARHGSGRVYHTYWDPDLGWQPLEMISDPNVPFSTMPSMTFSGGSAFVVWAESVSVGERGIRYSTGQYGDWSTPDWVSSGYSDEWPSVTARSNGDVYAVWRDGRNAKFPQIWGRLYTPGSFGGQAEPMATPQSAVELSPNPAKAGRVTVQYALPHAGPVTITLLDVSGRGVRRSTFDVRRSGVGSFGIDANGLRAGVYILKLESGTSSQTRKLVIQ